MKNGVKVTANEIVGSHLKVWLALDLKIHNMVFAGEVL